MRIIILSIFALSLVYASDFEVEGLVFGVSHHFNNRDEYQFNEFNPGLGLMTFYNVSEHSAIGGVVAGYKNSYYEQSRLYGLLYRYQLGDVNKFHYGLQGGIASLSGYDPSPCGYFIGCGFISYGRYSLDFLYMPVGKAKNCQIPSGAVCVWLQIKLLDF